MKLTTAYENKQNQGINECNTFFIENIYNRYIVLLAQLYTKLLSSNGVHP